MFSIIQRYLFILSGSADYTFTSRAPLHKSVCSLSRFVSRHRCVCFRMAHNVLKLTFKCIYFFSRPAYTHSLNRKKKERFLAALAPLVDYNTPQFESCEVGLRLITKWGKGEGSWRPLMDCTLRPKLLWGVCSTCYFLRLDRCRFRSASESGSSLLVRRAAV